MLPRRAAWILQRPLLECEAAQAVHTAWVELEAKMASMQIQAMAVKTKSATKSKDQLGEHGIEPSEKYLRDT